MMPPGTAGLPWAVLGGGISGLLAAEHLQRLGFEVEVWEASGSAGGLAQTLPWPGPGGEPGFLERGPQGFLVAKGSALATLLANVGVVTHRPGPRGPRWLGKGGRLHPSPASLAGLLRAPGLTWKDHLRILAEPFLPPGARDGDTLRSFFARRLGEGFARELLPALVASLLAAPPEQVGMEAVSRLRRLEAKGGLLWGSLREGPEWTVQAEGGSGALAQALARRLDQLRLACPARSLEALPGGGWRIHGDGWSRDAAQVVLALPADAASRLLGPLAPGATSGLAALTSLDLTVWHSRHPQVRGWERGLGLLIHPPEGAGLLGVISLAAEDPRGVPGLLQLRAYVGGAYPTAPALAAWPGVWEALKRWLPDLPEPVQVRAEATPGAFALLGPGHGDRVAAILGNLPPGLHWLGAARFGPSLKDLAQGIDTWAQEVVSPGSHRARIGPRAR